MSLYTLPFVLSDGKEIKVRGVASPTSDRFSINLSSGSDYYADTALHFNPRFFESAVVRNNHQGGWGEEEKDGGFPFAQGAPYEVRIVVTEPLLQIYVDGSYFCDFVHRVPIDIVRNVYIEGDTIVTGVSFQDANQGPNDLYPVPASIQPGSEIKIVGTPSPDADTFSINLCVGADLFSGTALHFNPRFGDSETVRNSYQDGWGDEETGGDFPFSQGSPYDVKIVVRESDFQIFVNGSHYCDFGHRMPIQSVRNVFIAGDTTIDAVSFNTNTQGQSLQPLPFDFNDGKEVIVRGSAYPEADTFSINLCSGEDLNSDTALHFNPRFGDSEVVRNSFEGGWGDEERSGDFPFSQGGRYEVRIIAKDNRFQIYVNGAFFCDFFFRLPLDRVRNVFISGDTTVENVAFQDNSPFFNPSVPFTAPIRGGMVTGRRIFISGRPYSSPERFNVNLMTHNNFDNGDVALHYDARFNYGSFENVVVRTSRIGGSFGEEETEGAYFPFAPEAPFDMIIEVEQDFFRIFVNNQEYCTFNFRLQPVQRVAYLYIQGDVEVQQVRFD